ncbi:hypothetical protein KVR01_011449 [Diaporthe batatas]|uniref:uncharacterized protein n=1 Tax=Diaporthe batatas TaxID=748121 RepID=UPI001D044804|nr:uncharacterized protein KVR01_011449 [Diaporthe batatas]KAG8159006.1 hypothetical protein KVR01_011449 [Diaporthe batatas]
MVLLEISNDYGYVLLAAASTVFVNIWHGVQTTKARKASGIGYPNTYATAEQAEKNPAAFQLNCGESPAPSITTTGERPGGDYGSIHPSLPPRGHSLADQPAAVDKQTAQRAHANFTENLTPYLTSMLIAGTRFPVPAAVMGAGWLVSRVVYTIGYTSGGPQGRVTGALGHYLFGLGLVLTACYNGVQMIRGV